MAKAVFSVLMLAADVFALLCVVRFFLQRADVLYRLPAWAFVVVWTEWAVRPLRTLFRAPQGQVKNDWACLPAGALFYFAVLMLTAFAQFPEYIGTRVWWLNAVQSVLLLSKAVATACLSAVLLQSVSAYARHYGWWAAVLDGLTAPLRRPFAWAKIGRHDASGVLAALLLWTWIVVLLPQIIARLNALLFVSAV